MVTVETSGPGETLALGRRVGEHCAAGTLLALVGDLGAGKTSFVKGLALGVGVPDDRLVTSPTFVLMNIHPGRVPLAHLDLYRLEHVDLASLGFHDIRDESVMAVEWAEKVEDSRWGDHLRVRFEVTGESTRRISFEPKGPRSEELLRKVNLLTARPLI